MNAVAGHSVCHSVCTGQAVDCNGTIATGTGSPAKDMGWRAKALPAAGTGTGGQADSEPSTTSQIWAGRAWPEYVHCKVRPQWRVGDATLAPIPIPLPIPIPMGRHATRSGVE